MTNKSKKVDLRAACGLPVSFDLDTCELDLGAELNSPSYCIRRFQDLAPVWAHPENGVEGVAYRYTAGLHLKGDESVWRSANVVYGIVIFSPGMQGGEYVKSSGQYHPPCPPSNMATPEIYTVLSGIGHFLLQKASPPYNKIEDVVMVEVRPGESFVVPPDYGHLQINPGPGPLVFSYVVMDGMKGVYDPFKERGGAMYFEMADEKNRYVFNPRYGAKLPLRIVRASDINQLPWMKAGVNYQAVRDRLPELKFLTDPTAFPASAKL
jgi:glucose-6-phosphate isomerase